VKRADGKADRRQSIENARMILVSIGVLAPRNALAGRYEAWALQVLAKVDQAADRWTLQQFHRHRLLPSVEARCEAGKATWGTVRQVQNQLRAAIELMAWSRPRGGLGRLSRSGVDEWLAGPSTRHWARQFLLWAIRQHLLDLPASAIPLRTPQAPSDVEDYQLRADLAHRLLHEEGTPADIRVAGLLVVLYGQHLSRIVSIERESVDPESMPPRIKLGRNWLELPDPMGQHIAELLAQAPRRSAPFAEDARWLFPGDGAGTHLSSDRLGVRLAKYGIHARSMRNTVLFHWARPSSRELWPGSLTSTRAQPWPGSTRTTASTPTTGDGSCAMKTTRTLPSSTRDSKHSTRTKTATPKTSSKNSVSSSTSRTSDWAALIRPLDASLPVLGDGGPVRLVQKVAPGEVAGGEPQGLESRPACDLDMP